VLRGREDFPFPSLFPYSYFARAGSRVVPQRRILRDDPEGRRNDRDDVLFEADAQ